MPGDEDYEGRREYGDTSSSSPRLLEEATGVGQQSTVLSGYLGRQQACQVDLRQDLLAVTVPV